MNEELELINTIFYYANTMDEYRQALQQNKILSRTIVFVDETQEIYKDGKLFGGYEKFVEQLNNLAQEVRDAMDQSEQDMQDLMRRLREQIWDQFQEEVELITENIQDYKDRLDSLREEFDQGYVEQGEARRDIDELNGIISDYVSWKTSVEGTLTTFSSVMNAQDATLRTFGERLDTINYTVTNYEHLVDLKEQTLKEYIENYDITNKVRSIIGREILLQEGLLHDFATITNVNDMVRTSVDEWFNALEPSWTQVTSWLSKVDANEIAIAGFRSEITGINDELAGVRAEVNMFANWKNENAEALAYIRASAGEDSSFFDLEARFDNDSDLVAHLAAKIFGYVNGTTGESTLYLQADHLKLQGYSMSIDVNNVVGLGDWILANVTVNKFQATDGNGRTIKINADSSDVYGIKSSTNGFYFKMDGSGYVANGAISWDAYGNLTIQGQAPNAYTPSGQSKTVIFKDVYISDYWSKTEFTPTSYVTKAQIGQNGDLSFLGNGSLQEWVTTQLANVTLGEGANVVIEQQVQTVLNNEIGRADGPFANFTRNGDLSTTLDGYVTKQGLATEVTGLIYDDQGNLLAGGPLYSALSTLDTLSGALIQNGQVVGAYTQETIESAVDNYIGNNSAISSLTTWAQSIGSNSTAGFTLQALVNEFTGNNTQEGADGSVGAYISGIVQDGIRNITISADQINLDGTVLTQPQNTNFYTKIEAGRLAASRMITESLGISFLGHTESPVGSIGGYSDGGIYINVDNGYLEISNSTYIDGSLMIGQLNGGSGGVNISVSSGSLVVSSDITADSVSLTYGVSLGNGSISYSNNKFRFNSGAVFNGNVTSDEVWCNAVSVGNGEIGWNSTQFEFSANVKVNGTITQNSDIRLKENFVDVTATTEDIAKVRTVNFNFKGKDETIFGSIAQDWQSIFPYAVKENENGMLSMDYGAIALGSAVTAAREIVALKKRIEELEAKLK